MYRRDLLTAEIQKLAEALAKIMGLKQQGKLEEAELGIEDMLENDFGIRFSDLLEVSMADFSLFLSEKDFPSEKLDMFSQVLYLKFNPAIADVQFKAVAQKLQLIYQILETKHHVINMINIGRQKTVDQYLNLNS